MEFNSKQFSMGTVGQPSLKQLRNARDELASLIGCRAKEAEFQSLFSRCPHVLSEALPIHLSPTEIRPIARPGKSDPDFIIIPRSGRGLESVGVIELKRPSTSLLTSSRKGLALLSRDVATAVAQGKLYYSQLRAELALPISQNLVISNSDYIFIIAGLTDEITRKLDSVALYDQLRSQLPGGCQIIPYDELLRRFEDALPPMTFMLSPQVRSSLRELKTILLAAEDNVHGRSDLNDGNMEFWSVIEDRWRAGNYVGSRAGRIINRSYWCVSGTNDLATESPAHIDFPAYVQHLLSALRISFGCHEVLQQTQTEGISLRRLQQLLTKRQVQLLNGAIKRCRANNFNTTFLDADNPLLDPDVEVLCRLGLLYFRTIESSDAWYSIDETLLELW